MSTAYKMIMDSLNEILNDLEETGGKNLKCETLTAEVATPKKSKVEHIKEKFKMKPARARLKKFSR